MIVTIVSESRGDSALKAASILDCYLPRIGRRTWTGHLSQEGINDLRIALRKCASRATAVACHLVRGSQRTGLLWVVGRRAAFGPGGEAPVSYTRKPSRPTDRAAGALLMNVAIALAADFHDLGKLSAGMQSVLVGSVNGTRVDQPVRHELLSLLLMHLMIRLSNVTSDRDMLALLSDETTAVAIVTQAWRRLSTSHEAAGCYGGGPDAREMKNLLPDRSGFPFFHGVALMVVSHHRLMRGRIERKTIIQTDEVHVSSRATLAWCEFLKPCDGLLGGLQAAGGSGRPSWGATLAIDARRTRELMAGGASTGSAESWSAACSSLGRLALMLGDYDGSRRSCLRPTDDPAGAAQMVSYANTRLADAVHRPDNDWLAVEMGRPQAALVESEPSIGRHLADPWDVHTHKVRRSALAAYGSLIRGDEGWPSLGLEDLPDALVTMSAPASRFRWQDDAASAVRTAAADHRNADGRLVFLIAGTGTGKTIAAAKLAWATAREGRMRVSVCLGLRSLTLQTGDEYRDRIGFSIDQAAVVIGSQASRLLHQSATTKLAGDTGRAPAIMVDADDVDAAVPSPTGTDADEQAVDGLVVGGWDEPLPRYAERVVQGDRNPDFRRLMLSSPILICTVDSLASVADARRGRHLGDALRIATSDLILDEIDAYEAEDFVALCRLVEASGFHGRSVTVASATLRTEHALAIRNAYALGRRLRAQHYSCEAAFIVGWFAECVAHVKIDQSRQDASEFTLEHRRAVATLVHFLSNNVARRRAKVIDMAGATGRCDYFQRTLEACLALHHQNHVIDPATGRRISVGFMRWNRVATCRAFAATLLDREDIAGVKLVVACHHSRYALAVKDTIDRSLARMLSRKHADGEPDPLLAHPRIRHHLDSANESDVVVIISTTPVLEAGRDLDADWAITEPCSVRSAIQLAGRVRRHRYGAAAAINVGILQFAITTMFGRGNKALAQPGVETTLRMQPSQSLAHVLVPASRDANDLFDIPIWRDRLDASTCLAGGGAPCGVAEEALLRWGVLGDASAAPQIIVDNKVDRDGRHSTRALLLSVLGLQSRPDWRWDDAHARVRAFRRPDPARVDIEYRLEEGEWWLRSPDSIQASRDARRARRPYLSEWQPGNNRYTIDWMSIQPHRAHDRLLFDVADYDVEGRAAMVEQRLVAMGLVVSRHVSRELRSLSIAPHAGVIDKRLWFHPLLGGHQEQLAL